ncbi:hypothetical protein [Streptomyces gossypiisoli]|uniref:hypothetical protein n=1 Tax=Streptomyces gossypiisoli TaxID=2748864 RepID=UPI0015DBCD57|nr:hypothetical protein [Streptomyces gossypiisoli]
MTPSRKRHVLALSIGTSALLVGTVTACATSLAGQSASERESSAQSQRSGESNPTHPGTANPGARNPTKIDEIAAYAEKHFLDSFTGVSAEGTTTVVHRVPRSGSALDEAITERFPSEPVRFADSPRTAEELEALTQRILADARTLRSHGVRVASVGPDIARGVVVVTTDDVEKAQFLLPERYGKGVTVEGPAPEVTFAG